MFRLVSAGLASLALLQSVAANGDDFTPLAPPTGDIGTQASSSVTVASRELAAKFQQAFGGNTTACPCCLGNPSAPTCSGKLTIGTTAIFYDLMTLHYVWNGWEKASTDEQGKPAPIKRHQKDIVTINNNGTTPLQVVRVRTADSNGWKVTPSRSVPFVLAPGEKATVEVSFTYKESWADDRKAAFAVASPDRGFEKLKGVRKTTLTIETNATTNPINTIRLAGVYQYHAETAPFTDYGIADFNVYSEPNVYQISDALGMSIRFSPQDRKDPYSANYRYPSGKGSAGIMMDLGPYPGWFSQENRRGDEVITRFWTPADSSLPVLMQPVTAFHTCCQPFQGKPWDQFSYLYFRPANSDTTRYAFRQEHSAGQMIYPRVTLQGDAGKAAGDGLKAAWKLGNGERFSLRIDHSDSDYKYYDRNDGQFIYGACKNDKGAGNCGHWHRAFPAYNSKRQIVPNVYFVITDNQPGNGDANDHTYILYNVKPAN